MSLFAWLDYSEIERGRMMDVIDLFREKDTIDELGVLSLGHATQEAAIEQAKRIIDIREPK